MEQDEKELVARSLKGDFQAFEEIVRVYQKRVFSFAYYRLRNRSDAEDLTQEVFWRVFSNLGKYDPKRRFFTWVFTLEINLIRNFIRGRKQGREVQDPDFYENIGFHDASLLSADDRMVLLDVLDELAPQERDLIYFKYADGLPVKEISVMLGISEENVKVKLFRAREKLKRIIGRLDDWEGGDFVLRGVSE